MKLMLCSICLATLITIGCTNEPTNHVPVVSNQQIENNNAKAMSQFEYAFNTAHPQAQALMKEGFYWSPIEETAPFGSDDGSDAAYGFRQWRQSNKTTSPVTYLKSLIAGWQYPYFDYNEMDSDKIKAYIYSKANPDQTAIQQQLHMLKEAFNNSPDTSMNSLSDEQLRELITMTSENIGGRYLLGQDNAIIGIGFAQLVLEGKIDSDMKALVTTAINRQLLPVLLNRYDERYINTRKQQLTKMLAVIDKAAS